MVAFYVKRFLIGYYIYNCFDRSFCETGSLDLKSTTAYLYNIQVFHSWYGCKMKTYILHVICRSLLEMLSLRFCRLENYDI